ncbi:MAG: HAD family phosphatase [Candidatus Omnitrophica bacterium]|nr:HAD family phosphatase [Candidatus Omnitrophota bacterium]
MPTKAVIFDMDGVLVDSMRYHVLAWQKTFRPLGVDITDHEIYAREGEAWHKSTKDFLRMGGYRPTRPLVEKVFKERCRIFKEIFRPRIFRGAKGLLRSLKREGFKLGLVTATPGWDVKKMLTPAMIELFDVMVCGGDTKKGKPHPEPYLKALKRLKIKPEEAVVIENAPYGITSCKLAGTRCIAVTTSLPKKYLKGADVVVDSLAEVADLV